MLRIWLRALLDVLRRAPAEHADVLLRDAKYARRVLRRRPAFAAVAVLTIAAGVGLNAAVFSVVNGVLLRSLPVKDADRLVRLYQRGPAPDLELEPVASANFLDWAAQTRTLDASRSSEPAPSHCSAREIRNRFSRCGSPATSSRYFRRRLSLDGSSSTPMPWCRLRARRGPRLHERCSSDTSCGNGGLAAGWT